MRFHCFVCYAEFLDLSILFKHLKNFHFFRDNCQELKCVVNKKCPKSFETFSGLRKHAKKCNIECDNVIETIEVCVYKTNQV